jgi:hypothetical protein
VRVIRERKKVKENEMKRKKKRKRKRKKATGTVLAVLLPRDNSMALENLEG